MSTDKKSGGAVSFDAAMVELESLVKMADRGDLPLEEAVRAYRRGIELVRYCQLQLQVMEEQVQVLDKEFSKLSVPVEDGV